MQEGSTEAQTLAASTSVADWRVTLRRWNREPIKNLRPHCRRLPKKSQEASHTANGTVKNEWPQRSQWLDSNDFKRSNARTCTCSSVCIDGQICDSRRGRQIASLWRKSISRGRSFIDANTVLAHPRMYVYGVLYDWMPAKSRRVGFWILLLPIYHKLFDEAAKLTNTK